MNRLCKISVAVCVLLSSSFSSSFLSAAGPALVITDKGYEVMTVGADGRVKTELVTQVVDLRSGANPVPPVASPPPVSESPVAQKVAGFAQQVGDPAGAAVLAEAVRLLIEADLPPSAYTESPNALGMAFSTVLVQYERKSPGARTAWQPFRDSLAGLINELRSRGELSTKEQWKKFLQDTQAGLSAAHAEAVLPTEILQLIRELLPFIMEIIKLFRGGV